MSATLQIIGPGVIDLIAGTSLSSLDFLPPGGFALSDSGSGAVITVTLSSGASLSASSAGGATVINGNGAITLSGDLAQIEAALASLIISDATAGTTTLSISATDGTLTTSTTLAVDVLPDSPPAFVAPPSSLALTAGIAAPLGLTFADDPAAALAVMGAAPESLAITLIATSGILLLDQASFAGIGVAGNASGTIILSATSNDLAELDAALGAVALDAASGGSLLYIGSQTGGPLAITDSSGSLTYSETGTITANTESWIGQQPDWQSASAWSGGFTPGLATAVSIGNGATIAGYGVAASMAIGAAATVQLEGEIAVDTLSLNGASALRLGDAALSVADSLTIAQSTLFVGVAGTIEATAVTLGAQSALINLGAMTVGGLDDVGFALLPGGAVLDGPVAVASGGAIDFAGILQSDSAASVTGLTAISLSANATIDGAGTLIAGNFSESEDIAGPGTILALGPAPLTISAGSIGGGVHLVIEPGAALELGAVSPLFGVFNPTPVTVGSDATISFAPGASNGQDSGTYASTLGEQGGVLVLDNPESFAATILNFAPGDRIAFATLTSLSSPFNITSTGFEVQGVNSANTSQSEIITIHTSLATGLTPTIETDAAGQQMIGLRPATASLTLNDVAASLAVINAVNGDPTPIQNLGLLVPTDGSLGLVLTIAASHGDITDGGTTTTALTLSAANALTLNNELGSLSYTAPLTGSGDVLDFTGGTGLAGLTAAIAIGITNAGTLDYTGGNGGAFNADAAWSNTIAPANGDLAIFASHAGAPVLVTGPGVAGGISIAGGYDFSGAFDFAGSAGTALELGGGFALFDANAIVTLGAAAIIGNSTGSGTLAIAGTVYAPADITLGGAGPAGSLLDITGSLSQGQTIAIGAASAATLEVSGAANVAATTLGGSGAGSTGLIRALGSAVLSLGSLDIVSGTLTASGDARIAADAATLASGAIDLSGQSSFTTPFGLDIAGGTLTIGAEATQAIGPGTLTLGATAALDLQGQLTAAMVIDSGSGTLAGGKLSISQAISLTSGALLTLTDGTIAASSITIDNGATLTGAGFIGASTTGVSLIPIDAAGILQASNGTLSLGGSLIGNATIAAGAALALAGAESSGTIGFIGANAALTLANPQAMQDAVTNFSTSDAIDLIGIAPSLVSISGGFVHIGSTTEFAFTEAPNQAAAAVSSDGAGGSLITVGGAMACFTRGTNLLTPAGYRAVETLRPNDRLITRDGTPQPIRWIGRRTIDLAADPAAPLLRPVIIAPGAFGPGRPRRALSVSPLHAIMAGDALIPAILLVNNATITRDDTRFAVTYYHVELDRHDVILAEDLHCETYRDTGNRDRFLESVGTPGTPMPSCLNVVLHGTILHAARQTLHDRALALGHQIVHGPMIAAQAGPHVIPPRHRGKRLLFDLPIPADRIMLHCATGMASDTDPACDDRRSLGICAGTLRSDGKRIAVWHGAGWHALARDDRGLWSTDRAELRLANPARSISLELRGSVPRWARDAAVLAL